jgi:hypothetical protein
MADLDLVHSERDVFVYYLNGMRQAVIRKSEGLTEEQLRTPDVTRDQMVAAYQGGWPAQRRDHAGLSGPVDAVRDP